MRGIVCCLASSVTLLRAACVVGLALQTTRRTTCLSAVTELNSVEETVWKPRSRFWVDHDLKDVPRSDLAKKMEVDIMSSIPPVELKERPRVTKVYANDFEKDKVVAVEVSSALTESEAMRVQTMAASLRDHDKFGVSQFEHRSFGPNKGGNDCTYLAPILQLLMPEVAAKVVSIVRLAWEEAGWEDDPIDLGIRTSEHLAYDGWRSLEPHKDVGSIYTCNIALKEPEDYEGGQFFLNTSVCQQAEIKPRRLSAIVFLSNTIHGVRPITSGSRVSFVTEFWKYDDAPIGMNRPTPDEWEDFLKKDHS